MSNGRLLTTNDSKVNFFASSLITIDQDEFDRKIFEVTEDDQEDKKRLPLQISVFDFAQLHHFDNKTEEALFEALADSDESELFEVKFVQALLEFKYPAIREPFLKWLMAPFVLFLAMFCYYSMVHFEAVDKIYREQGQSTTFLLIEGVLIRVCLFGLSLYFIINELTQIKRSPSYMDYFADFWNLIDWAPLILMAISLLLSGVV